MLLRDKEQMEVKTLLVTCGRPWSPGPIEESVIWTGCYSGSQLIWMKQIFIKTLLIRLSKPRHLRVASACKTGGWGGIISLSIFLCECPKYFPFPWAQGRGTYVFGLNTCVLQTGVKCVSYFMFRQIKLTNPKIESKLLSVSGAFEVRTNYY